MPGAGGGGVGGGVMLYDSYRNPRVRIRSPEEIKMTDEVHALMREACRLNNSLIEGLDIQRLLNAFYDYIAQLDKTMNISKWNKIKIFVTDCFRAIENSDFVELERLMAESNIESFKSTFSKTAYDVVKPFQFFYTRRKEETAKAIDKVVGTEKVIKEEDESLYIKVKPKKKEDRAQCRSGCLSLWSERPPEQTVEEETPRFPRVLLKLIDEYNQNYHKDDIVPEATPTGPKL